MSRGKKRPHTKRTAILATATAALALYLAAPAARGADANAADANGAVRAPKWRGDGGGPAAGADLRRPRGGAIKVERGARPPAGATRPTPKKVAEPPPREVFVGTKRRAPTAPHGAAPNRAPRGAAPRGHRTVPHHAGGGRQGEGRARATEPAGAPAGGKDGLDALRAFLGQGGGGAAPHDEGRYRDLIFQCDGGILVLPGWGARYGCVLGGLPAGAGVDVIPADTSPGTCRAAAAILPGGTAVGLAVAPTEEGCAFWIELVTADGGGNLRGEGRRVLKRIIVNPRSDD